MRRFNFFNTKYPFNNYFFLLIVLIFLAVACNRQVNETAKSTKTIDKTENNKKPQFETVKPDTTYEQRGNSRYIIVSNPHPEIGYIKKGPNLYYEISFYKDSDGKDLLSQEEKLSYVKEVINFNDELDSLAFKQLHIAGIYHKGVKVQDFYIEFTKNFVQVKYINSLDLNVSNIISEKEARNIAINKIKATEDFEFATPKDITNANKKLKENNKTAFEWFSRLDTATAFYIKRIDNSYLPIYKFIIYRKTFVIDYVFTINALNGDIIEKEYYGAHSCKQCVSSNVVEADCNKTHPVDIGIEVLANTVCDVDLGETYQFDSFPDAFGGCSSIQSSFFKCPTIYNGKDYNGVVLTDVDQKITSTRTPENLFERLSLDNTSFIETEQQQLTAYKNMEIAYDYYLHKVSSENLLRRALEGLEISAGYLINGVSFANTNFNRIVFTNNDNCLPQVSPMIVSHELTHLILARYYGLLPGATEGMPENTRLKEVHGLHESLSDIMAVLAQYDDTSTIDWSLFDELGCSSVRRLNDPMQSNPSQSIAFNNEETSDDEYYWAGITSYWFYLLTEPSSKEVSISNGMDFITIGNGIGLEKAEEFMFSIFENIRESIRANENPVTEIPFDRFVDMIEFRDIVLTTASQLFKEEDSDYNICSPEYTKVYRALDAVGLIDANVLPPCNIINYGVALEEDCPDPSQYSCSDESGGKSSLITGFPANISNPNDTYWIQVAVDFDDNGKFEDDEIIKDQEAITNNIVNHKTTVGGLPNKGVEVQILVTNITSLKNELLGAASLPYVEYVFSCNNGCNLITDINNTGYVNETPPVNTGNININIEKDIEICAGSYFCLDYEVNAPAFVNVKINSDKFTKHITQSGTINIGQFCWQPTINDLGNYTFSILASDEHPVEPLFNTETINVNVKTYSTFGCGCAGTFPAKTVNLENAVASGHYVALEDLESSGKLYSTADIIFKGGESVSLNNGFYAPASTNFEAYIANCPDFPDPNREDP